MSLTKLSTDKDVWEYNSSDAEGIEDLEVDDRVWHVTFTNSENGETSTRAMVSHQGTCTVTVAKGYTGEDDVTIKDQSGNEATDHITFS
jgi:hypothetical protein